MPSSSRLPPVPERPLVVEPSRFRDDDPTIEMDFQGPEPGSDEKMELGYRRLEESERPAAPSQDKRDQAAKMLRD
jgi:hypothetical protein